MPIDYRNLGLSSKEKVQFIFTTAVFSLATGFIFYDSLIAGLILCLSGFYIIRIYKETVGARNRSKLLVQFRDMLYSISSAVTSGRNMTQALEESLEFWKTTYSEKDYIMLELKYMVNRIRGSNEKDIEVLRDFAERSGLGDIRDFTAVYENTRSSGGNLPLSIERATSIIGEKINLERELKTLMAQKMFEGRIVGVAPFAVILLLKLLSPAYMAPMYTTGAGRFIMTFSLGLMGVAMTMIERINRIES